MKLSLHKALVPLKPIAIILLLSFLISSCIGSKPYRTKSLNHGSEFYFKGGKKIEFIQYDHIGISKRSPGKYKIVDDTLIIQFSEPEDKYRKLNLKRTAKLKDKIELSFFYQDASNTKLTNFRASIFEDDNFLTEVGSNFKGLVKIGFDFNKKSNYRLEVNYLGIPTQYFLLSKSGRFEGTITYQDKKENTASFVEKFIGTESKNILRTN